jgi:hypothetical protein
MEDPTIKNKLTSCDKFLKHYIWKKHHEYNVMQIDIIIHCRVNIRHHYYILRNDVIFMSPCYRPKKVHVIIKVIYERRKTGSLRLWHNVIYPNFPFLCTKRQLPFFNWMPKHLQQYRNNSQNSQISRQMLKHLNSYIRYTLHSIDNFTFITLVPIPRQRFVTPWDDPCAPVSQIRIMLSPTPTASRDGSSTEISKL